MAKNKNLTPLLMDEHPILPPDAKPEDIKVWYLDGKKQKVYLVQAPEEVCQEVVGTIEREKKRRQRQMQKAASGKAWEAIPKSLSKEVCKASQESDDEYDLVLQRLLFDELVDIIEKKNPLYGPILRMTKDGLTQEEIALTLGKSQSTIKKQQILAIDLLRKLYKEMA